MAPGLGGFSTGRSDPIWGSGGIGWGRAGAAFGRLMECACRVRDSEHSDEVAVAMLQDAAGGDRRVLRSFAQAFAVRRQEWVGDPHLEATTEAPTGWAAPIGARGGML